MTPQQLETAAIRIYGRKHWRARLADALAVDVSTIHRLGKRLQIPGPYEIAVNGMLEHHRRQVALAKEARRLLPRKIRKRKPRKDKQCTTLSSEPTGS